MFDSEVRAGAPGRAAIPMVPCVHELFEHWAAKTPDALAVSGGGSGSLTYRELDERANRLAHYLRSRGVGTEVPVGVLTTRSPEMMVAILAALKAGGCYMPLDPAYPEERLAFILEESGARVLLTQERVLAAHPGLARCSVETFRLDADWPLAAALPSTHPGVRSHPLNLAYVIYTSGSTGRPKGVEVEHRALANMVGWFVRESGIGPEARATRTAGPAFDASVYETWPPMTVGASLHIPGDELVLSPPRMIDWLRRERITHPFLPTPLAEAVLDEPWPAGMAVQALLTGGDRLRRGLRDEHPFELWNLYGPSENAVISTWAKSSRKTGGAPPPIGRAIDGVRTWLAGPDLAPLPDGEPGELMLGGAGLARGYRRRPDLTAERFLPDPLGAPGDRAYRTGDLARTLPSGDLDFIGRVDFQVKVRGFRIELGEIDSALLRHPEVREAVVLAREDGRGGKRLVGYVAFRGAVDEGAGLFPELEELLGLSLPEYMVPRAWVAMESLPLTPNGKVDRRALPEPPRGEESFVAPRTAREETLAAVFAEVLGLERVGIEEDFFALGGHSLQATQVVSRVRSRLGVEMAPAVLYERPTVAALAAALQGAASAEDGWEIPALERGTGDEYELPLSFAQQRLWLADRWSPEPALYNTPLALELDGELDAASLARALAEIVARHEPLRGRFEEVDGRPVLIVRRRQEQPLPVCDLSSLPADLAAAEAERIEGEEARRPFALDRGPLLRTVLLRLAPAGHRLLALMHHIVDDDWSISVMARELAALYEAFSRGLPSPLPPLAVQYGDFAAWQRRWLAGPALERQLAWWREALRPPLPVIDLPADRPRPAQATFRGERLRTSIPAGRVEALEAVGRRADATLFMALLAAFDVLLFRYTGNPEVIVGSPIANRDRTELEGLVGFFINTLALRNQVDGDARFLDLLGEVRRTLLGAYEHQTLPFDKLVEELAPDRDASRHPLVDVFVIMANALRLPDQLAPGLGLRMRELEVGISKVDLSLFLEPGAGGLALTWEYNRALFDRATIERMAGHFEVLVAGLAAAPERAVLDLPLLSAGERAQIAAWNAETAERPRPAELLGATLHGLFAAQAARTPQAIALIDGEERLTYAGLAGRVTALARSLRGLGIGPEVPAGIFLERRAELIVALLATLEAGGFYVPLDPAYPAERVAFMLEDSGCAVVLTTSGLEARLPGTAARLVRLDEELPASPALPALEAVSGNLAYLIYTSGSTGRPKAVAIEHRSAVALLLWARREYSGLELSGMLASTSITFDMSVFEVFAPLAWGGTVILAENALALPTLPARNEVRLIDTVPSAIAELLRTGGVPPSVVTVNLGGEPVPRALADRAYAQPGLERLYNVYGPSEDTTFSTWALIERASERPPAIGRPLDGSQGWVVDARLRPAPVGVPGELFLGGEGLSRGYLGRPELTAERYLPDPFAAIPGSRMYRTGDLARYRPGGPDGELEFLGRIDHQVKIRGFRVEPGEVEAALSRLPGVEGAAVLARTETAIGVRLAAYVSARPGERLEIAHLREGLRERLPDYMVPTAWSLLEALPLTPNGKIDRRALSRLPVEAETAGSEYVAPRGPVEAEVAAVFAGILGLERVGARDHFFELGGHSLLVTQVLSRLRKRLGVELPMRLLFEQPTVEELARRIAAAGVEVREGEPPLAPRPRDGALPLSFAQQRLWLLDRLRPGSAVYNIPLLFRVSGPLRPEILIQALEEVRSRHEALRTVFAFVAGEPAQVILPEVPATPVIDLGGMPAAERQAEVRRLAAEEAERPFDLSAGPLVRAALYRLDEEEHALLLNLHHIVADGWSVGVLGRELKALYAAFAAGLPSPLPPLPVQYADFALWQREWLAGEALEAQLAFWRERLAGLTPLELATDRPRPPVQTFRGGVERLALPAGTVEELHHASAAQGATLFMTLLAAFQALLHRHTGQEDLAVGTPVANRARPEVEGLIGFFVNTLVLRADLSGDPAFAGLLGRVRETALAAYAHQDLPFERLVEELAPGRDLSRTPLFQVAFALQDEEPPALELGAGIVACSEEIPGSSSKFDLSLHVERRPGGWGLAAEYATDLFDGATIQRMLRRFSILLGGIAAQPGARLSDLPLLTPEEREQLLVEWNRTESAYPREATIPALFAGQARRTPGAVAVVAGDERLTYGELAGRADRLARRLRALGVGPEVPVALLLERSPEMVVAMLAVLAAGGVYVPLDPKDPIERLRFVLEDTGAPVVVVREALPEGLETADGARLVVLDALEDAAPPLHPDEAAPANLAYVIYTSGSTGRPKGVAVHHQAVSRLVLGTDYLQIAPGNRIAHLANPAFDAATFEVWGALLNGATLVVIPREVALSPQRLAGEIAAQGVTALFCTTALFNLLVREAPGVFGGLHTVLFGGERVDPATVRACLETAPPARLLHVYGPTEGTTFTTWHRVEKAVAGETVPIGLPLANTTVHVLDQNLRPVPVGVPGELYAGGDGVARGYLHRPDLTAERFVPDPFAAPGARLYRTGDLVRRRSTGDIEFLGRLDNQVKVRGFRVELGEIEAVLLAHPRVTAAAVLVREDGPGDRRLIAYVAAEATPDLAGELRDLLRARLPEPMVPSAFAVLDALPLNPNGKIDRKALAMVDPEPGTARADFVAPRTPLEERVAAIWREVLGIEEIGAHDSFWDLGGHSLVATKVLARLNEAIGVELPLQTLFEHPTPAGLAAAAGRVVREQGGGIPRRPRQPAGEAPPLSFAQQRLWLLDRLEPGGSAYNMPFPARLTGPLDPAVLAAAASEVVRRHEALRTTFAAVDGVPVQVIAPPAPVPLPLIDLSGLPEAAREEEGRRLALAEAKTPFDLERGPLVRLALARLAPGEHLLLLDMHHIVSDGWSVGLFFNELSDLYAAVATGAPSTLPEPAIQYADFALWQREWLRGPALEEQLGYWRERLAGSPPALELPTDRVRPAVQTHRGDVVRHVLPPALTGALRELSRREGASLFMTLLAGFKVLLSRLADQDDVVVGSPSAGRLRVETEGLIGFFLNTLVLRTDLSGEPDFRGLLARVKAGVLGAYRYQEVPFEKLLEELQPERQLSRTPFFQVLFNMVNLPPARLEMPGVRIEMLGLQEPDAKFDFTLYVEDRDGRIEIDTVYNADLFERSRMEEMGRQLEHLLAAAAGAPDLPVGLLPLVTPAAARLLPDPSRPLGDRWMGSVHQGLSRGAARFPERTALSGPGGEVWTYAELEARSNQLAHFLRGRDLGIGTGDVVAVWARRSPALAWALMGTLKAGAAFMILDPAYPAGRLLDYLRIGRPKAWLGVPGAPPPPPEVQDAAAGLARIELADAAERLAGFDAADPAVPIGPDDAACITFTSGSTGKPKGVVGRHGPLSHFYPWLGERFGFSEADHFGMLSALSHDPLQRDLFTPLWFGAALAVPDPGRIGSPGYLAGWVREEGVTVLNLTPAMMELLTLSSEERPGEGGMPSLRLAFVVGDLLKKSDVERLHRHAPALTCVNLYGSTETQRSISWFVVPRPETAAWAELGHEALPLGVGSEGVQLLVLNRAGRLAGVGEAGEIHIRGPHLARGYLGDPALTAERFLPNPFAAVPSPADRLYRTGDLGRYRPDGVVEFAGRADFQVKVRGFRVELGEIEAALARFPGVKECVVIVREDRPGGRRLAAYLVLDPGSSAPPPRDLQAFLGQRLPDYMVPSAYVALPALPLTQTGKIDRRALPAPPEETAAAGRELSPAEELLAGLWADLLGRERIAPADDFFALGGHSLLATRLISRVRDAFGVELPLRALFEAPALEGLAATIERALSDGGATQAPPLVAFPRDGGPLPVSFAQRRLWFLDQLEPGGSAYNLSGGILLDGDLAPAVFAHALSEIVRRHEALRVTFAAEDGEPYAVAAPPAPFNLPMVDLSGLPEALREPEAARLGIEDGRRPFDLARGPLLRFTLLRLGGRRHAMLSAMHHAISDGWSLGVLAREVSTLYPAFLAGRPSPLPDLRVQYADFAHWQREWLRGEALAAQLAWWRGHLDGAPPFLDLPTDRPRPVVESHRGGLVTLEMGAGLTAELEALARRLGATPFMVLLGAWATLLARTAGVADVVVGTPIANRGRSELEDLIGFFANTLALRVNLQALERFTGLVRQVRESALGAYAHQDLPFERLVEELHPDRALHRSPVFQVTFAFQNVPFTPLQLSGLTLAPLAADVGRAQFDLGLALVPLETGLQARLNYSADLFDGATARSLLERLRGLLAGIAEDPEARVFELPLLTPAEREQVLAWRGTRTEYPREATIHGLFAEAARRSPEAVAVVRGGESLTYAALDARAGRIAARLRALGVGPEVPVGLCAERSPGLIVALLGILKAGGAYVPLDPGYPAERLEFLLADTKAPVVVVQERMAGALPVDHGAKVAVLEELEATEAPPFDPPAVDADNLAYLMYTSGSTGRPKGVAVTHRNVVRLVRGTGFARFGPGEVFLQFAPVAFDASTLEIWGALLNGGRLAVMPPGTPSLAELGHEVERQGVTTLWLTAGLFHQMVEDGLPGLRAVRQLLAGGDVLSPAHARRALEALPETVLINGYGPTENTTFTTTHAMRRPEEAGAAVPIGRPIANTRVHLLDAAGNPVPPGVTGALYAGGDGLSRGYLGRPGLTAERFVPDAAGGEPGARLYATGDLARWRRDGALEFVGRADQQVKIRGFRVELGEIEEALNHHPEVAAAAVAAREDLPGDKRLVAYVVWREGSTAGVHDLRAALETKLPEPMRPGRYVFLDALPLTANGKVDRRALPAPDPSAAEQDRPFEPPRTGLERQVAGIWADILGVPRIGLHDSFWDLGGHSLLATRVVSRLRDRLGIDLPLRLLFEEPVLEGFCRAISGTGADGAPPLVPWPREGALPLSFAQQRLWVLDRFEPGSTAYNMMAALRIRGPLRPAVLAAALEEIVRRHESLRTVFRLVDGEPAQVVLPALPGVLLPVADLRALPAPAREEEAARLTAEEARRPFDLAAGPLLRTTLLALAGEHREEHQLLLAMHHIVSDGWSVGVLVRELSALCNAFAAGAPSPLPELPVQYADFALWQRKWLAGGVLHDQLAYWRGKLAGVPLLELPTDRPRPRVQTFRGAATGASLPGALGAELERLGRRGGATPFMTLLAAFQVLLHRYTGQTGFAVGSPISGRNRSESEGLIGFFVNTLVLRADLAGDPAFPEVLARVRETALAAFAHQDVFFERLVEELAPERSLAHTPIFQVTFALQEQGETELDLGPGITIEGRPVDRGTAKFDLAVDLARDGSALAAAAEYSTDLFDAATIRRMLDHLGVLLAGIVANPEARLSELPLLTEGECQQILGEWQGTRTDYPREATIHGLFAEVARRTPDAVAVVFGEESLTYAALDARAERLASRLRALGIGPEVPVGLCAERSPELIVALLGILKAGGAYVPLDPGFPAERLAFMIEDTGAPVVVAQERLAGALPAGAADRVVLLEELEAPDAPASSRPTPAMNAANLAYLMFTSGSTGRPKGVAVTHRNVVRLVRGTGYARFGPEEVFLQFGPVAFDASTWEIWGPLLNGGRLALMPPGTPSLADLGRSIERYGVTSLFLTTGLFHQMVEEGLPGLGGVRQLLAGGDVLSPSLMRRARAALPAAALSAVYGPTENTTFTTHHPIVSPEDVGATVPLGRPIANTRVHLLDAAGNPVPAGVTGALYAAGDGLARGYLGRPELTAERFIPDGVSGEAGARLYATGDLARWRPDGALEFIGRADQQVKIRGFRVELGEVEEALTRHPEVAAAAVAAREDGSADNRGDKRLVAYVVWRDGSHADARGLRSALEAALPEAMRPSRYVFLDRLPLNANGKVDRRALPAPDREAEETGGDDPRMPRTPAEELLAGAFAALLGLDRVGVRDDFFHLGGHSLLATRLVSRVREIFGVEVPLRAVFEAPTVEGLAAMVEAAGRRGKGLDAPPVLPRRSDRNPPLSFAQQRLWFLDRLQPGSAVYNVPLPLHLRGPLSPPALGAALAGIVQRHEVLRTVFALENEEPVQIVRPVEPAFPLVDLSALPGPALESESSRLAGEEARRPFDLAAGPVLRATLVRLGEEDHRLLLTLHHIAADGWSLNVLINELSALYGALLAGQPSPLPELPIQYADFAVWQRGWLRDDVLAAQLAFWRRTLEGCRQVIELPADRPRPLVQTQRGASERFALPAGLSAALERASRERGATLYMTLLAAYGILVHRYTGEGEFLLASPIANRNRAETEGLIGFFVNTLVLRNDLTGDPDFATALARVRDTALAAYAHQDLPFEKLVEELSPERDLSRGPLAQLSFSLQNVVTERRELVPGLAIEGEEVGTRTAKFDLALGFQEVDGILFGGAEYSTDLFDAVTVQRLFGHLHSLLEGIVADPGTAVADLPLLTDGERRQLAAWHAETAVELPAGESLLHELFEAPAARPPQALALVAGAERLTYAELAGRAEALARRLRALGVGPERGVGLCLSRNADLVIAMLATLKAGGFYVPLDPAYPAERLAFMLEDSGCRVILAHAALLDRLPPHDAEVVVLDGREEAAPETQSVHHSVPGNLAYLIYTSGSTGRPKAVAIEHRSAVLLARWAQRDFTPAELARVLASTSITFDLSVFEIFVPLAWGGAVILADNALALSRLPARNEVTLINTVPSAISELLRMEALPASLITVNLAGEALTRALADRVHEQLGIRRLYNLYGPSEDTTYSTYARIDPGSTGAVPIGRPIDRTQAHVVDFRLRPLPVGVPGELVLGGDSLARGYLGRPELTAERFVPDDLGGRPGARLYRTGDLVRRRPDGVLDFLGRIDHQVKVRGFRIELGEIESALLLQPGIEMAVVVAREDAPGDQRLVAYVARSSGTVTAEGLRQAVQERLPQYMVPSVFVLLDELPLTANGKVDRRRLPAPEAPRSDQEFVEPRTELEREVARIWTEVLGVERVGLHDNFWSLGGHSLLATKVLVRIQPLLDLELPIQTIFESPTLGEFTTAIGQAVLDQQGDEDLESLLAEMEASLLLSETR
ncbi:MAG: non-ribosomal peptide synthase/polyketide synthase [Thermoanaerobaculia bacterium]